MAFRHDTTAELPDLTGKVAIVTGPTYVYNSIVLYVQHQTYLLSYTYRSGVGLFSAAVLLRKGAKVYFAARNEEKAKTCIKRIEEEGLGPGNGQAVFLHLDLADPRNAKKSAEEFLEKEVRLDILGMCSNLHKIEPELLFILLNKVNNAAL